MKICANTCIEDALGCARLGADAVGFVFAESTRRVTALQVRGISAELPDGLERVGVFGAGTAEEIAGVATEARLTGVQLHGELDLEVTRKLAELLPAGVGVIQTVHWSVALGASAGAEVAEHLAAVAARAPDARVLVDTKVGAASGGTGRSFDWELAKGVVHSQPGLRVIVAGGLRPENVAEAVRVLRPWGVDVASGVEREPGKKDFGRVKAFIENARGA